MAAPGQHQTFTQIFVGGAHRAKLGAALDEVGYFVRVKVAAAGNERPGLLQKLQCGFHRVGVTFEDDDVAALESRDTQRLFYGFKVGFTVTDQAKQQVVVGDFDLGMVLEAADSVIGFIGC